MNEQRQANGLTVEKYNIIGTAVWVYGAWEPSECPGNGLMHGHSTVQYTETGVIGQVGTRRLTPELDALKPYSQERLDAVRSYHEAQYAEAHAAILAAFPETAEGRREGAEIVYCA